MAFVLSANFVSAAGAGTRSSFYGDAFCTPPVCPPTAQVTMQGGLDKYSAMNDDARPVPPAPASSGSSSFWTAYRDSLKAKVIPYRAPLNPETDASKSAAAVLAATTSYAEMLRLASAGTAGSAANPETQLADQTASVYMSECVTWQYKAMANPTGIYSIACTEGAAKLQAEESRELSLLAAYRQKQRTTAQKYGDFTESRRVAVAMSHGCSYEEDLVARYPLVAKSMIRGYSEAKSLCVRYNVANTAADTYMSRSVDMRAKVRAVPNGVYTPTCADSNQKGLADFKRVQALAARFRANQMSLAQKAQARYDARSFARTLFPDCNYDEALANQFPAAAASCRPSVSRY